MGTILVIDDDDTVRSTLCLQLREAGYTAIEAFDGASGLKAAAERPVDLMIVDVLLGSSDGVALLQRARANGLARKFVLISGSFAMPAEMLPALARRMGADAALAKPFRGADLLRAVQALLPIGLPEAGGAPVAS